MVITEPLYDPDGSIRSFDAQVQACFPDGNRWAIQLDRTAFFPEGGGQYADTGTLGNARVLDVQITENGIVHYTDQPLPVGDFVHGELDWARRFRSMQNHTGEHIVSGVIHRLYGLDNVGFHLGEDDVTMDFNGELTRAQLLEAERLANDAVFRNLPVTITHPAPEELPGLEYRSKLDLTENVRLVTIGDVDCCACCAPHVSYTGEIGLIKLLDFMRFRGGIRLHIRCGGDALADYNVKYRNILQISALFSAKQEETAAAAQQFYDALQAEKHTVAELKKQLARAKAAAIPQTAGGLCLFEEGDSNTLREMVNIGMTRCETVCGVFCGNDTDGYRYILGSRSINLRAQAAAFNTALHGRGGGSPEMIQGSVQAARSHIEAWFAAHWNSLDFPQNT